MGHMRRRLTGFTVLELLMVVAGISVLAGLVIVAVNPGRQLLETRDARREVDVHVILNAVYQYASDNNGAFPAVIPTEADCATASGNEICREGSASCSGYIDLSVLTDDDRYLVDIPSDPSLASLSNGIGYRISRSGTGRLTVCAPDAEGEGAIAVTR